ncbi:MAG: STAS domain-containing protein [Anaerolineales bacterium]|nr:STAS domain-containing protein [Anaerolineales bacterium]
MSGLQISVSQEQGRVPVTVLRIEGDVIDANSYQKLEAQARAAMEAGARDLLLDLTKMKYISSAGLRAIHTIFLLLRGDTPGESDETMKKGLMDGSFKSPHLKLLNPSPAVTETLRAMGFDMFLEVHRNLKDAIASF